jgi:predicted alpha/beta hydrolase
MTTSHALKTTDEAIAAEAGSTVTTLPVTSADGARFDLILTAPADARIWIYWCPAMGVTARQYRIFAEAVANAGVGIAAHEWRGAGSSDRRASRHSDWGYRELIDDIDAGVAALRAARDVQRLVIGGHSLGAQVGMLALARHPRLADAVLMIGSGTPWWRTYPLWQQPLIFAVFAWFRALSAICGWFPGRRVGFAGDEARSVIRDWTRSGMSGRYRPDRLGIDLDMALAALKVPGWALHLHDDRFAPQRSSDELRSRLAAARWTTLQLGKQDFASRLATHFSWMKDPLPVVTPLAAWLREL